MNRNIFILYKDVVNIELKIYAHNQLTDEK